MFAFKSSLLSALLLAGGHPECTTASFYNHHYQPAFVTRSSSSFPASSKTKHNGSPLFGKRMKYQVPSRVVAETEYIKVQADGEDAWKTMDVVEILNQGGVGVLPTDSGYCFVTPLQSKTGLERLIRIKGMERCKKPLSLLCRDLSSIDEYCFGIDKLAFKILKKNLPGPYTFIFPAKTTLPKGILLDSKGQKHSWKRQTLGVRIPDDPVLRYLQDELLDGMPLLTSSLPVYGVDGFDEEHDEEDDDIDEFSDELSRLQLLDCNVDIDASWFNEVDFIVDAGPRPYDGSTIFDLTQRGDPIVVREGLGELELAI